MQAQQPKINISEALQQINWYELESLEDAIAERKRQMVVNKLNSSGFKFRGVDTGVLILVCRQIFNRHKIQSIGVMGIAFKLQMAITDLKYWKKRSTDFLILNLT